MIQVLRETHEVPLEVSRILLLGGLNRYGEPNYRAVWGQSRLDWIGGKWEDRNAAGEVVREVTEVRHVPKYAVNRWIIERWMPPESYGPPALWEMQTLETVDGKMVPALGPYPSRGDYEHCFTCETTDGQFLELTPMIARAFVQQLELSRETRPISRRERFSREQARQDREYDSFADSTLNDGSTITGPSISVL